MEEGEDHVSKSIIGQMGCENETQTINQILMHSSFICLC